MTFYNIIFGILFLGACQTVLIGWLTGGDTLLILFVTILIFNDVVNTSEVIERREFDYTIYMKLLDLVSFFALATALILLSGEKNFLDVEKIPAALPSWLKYPSAPPIALLVYCLSVIAWNLASEELRKKAEWPNWLLAVGCTIVAAVLALIYLRAEPDLVDWYRFAVAVGIIATLCYLVSYAVVGRRRGANPAAKAAPAVAPPPAAKA
jgi:hypothetical protein